MKRSKAAASLAAWLFWNTGKQKNPQGEDLLQFIENELKMIPPAQEYKGGCLHSMNEYINGDCKCREPSYQWERE